MPNDGGSYPDIRPGQLSLTAGANITLSQVGNTITISGGAGGTGGGGGVAIQASDATYTTNTVIFSGVGGGATVKSAAGQHVDISVAAQSVQIVQSALQGSDATYTSGKVILTGVGGGITVNSNTGQRIDLSVAAPVAQTAQTGISSIQGSDATYTSGKIIFTGVGGGITVSSNTAQRIDLSVAAPVAQTVQTQNLVDVTLSGNSTSGGAGYVLVSSGTLTLAGGNRITLSQDGNAVTISGAAAAAAQTGISSLQGSDATYTSGKVIFTGVGGGITVSSNTGQRIDLSVAAPVAQTAQTGISSIQASDATYTSGKVIFTGVGGGITISSNTGQRVDLSVAAPVAQTVQTQNMVAVSATNTLYSSGTVVFTGSNMITVKSSANNQTVIIDATQSAQTQSNLQAVVPLGNTVGTTGSIQTGTFGLAGGANITISQSSGTASTNLTIIGGAGAAGIASIQVSDATYTSGKVIFSAAGGAITVASGAAQHVDLSVPATTSLSASTNITLSVNGSTIKFSVANPPNLHQWQNTPIGDVGPLTALTAISKTPFYWPEYLPGAVTLNSIGFLASVVTTGTLQSFTVHFGVYTFVNSTSAALLGSAAESFVLSTGTSASFSGQRIWVLTTPGTVAAISNLTPGNYLFGSMISAGATGSMNLSLFGATNNTAVGPLGIIMPGTNNPSTATSQGVLLYGRGSTTVNAMPANVSRADLVNQGAGASVPIHPYMLIRS